MNEKFWRIRASLESEVGNCFNRESHSSAPLISTSLPTENGRRGREIKSARKPPRLGSSFV